MYRSFQNLAAKTLKSVDLWRSYRQKISWLLFMAHGVVSPLRLRKLDENVRSPLLHVNPGTWSRRGRNYTRSGDHKAGN